MKECNSCNQEWDDDFFCINCSSQIEDSLDNPEDKYNIGNICLNCCTCHSYNDIISECDNDLPF